MGVQIVNLLAGGALDLASGKESANAGDARDMGSIPGSGRFPPQRKKRYPTAVFLPGKSHGQRSLVGYSPWGRKKSDVTKCTYTQDSGPVRGQA